LIQAPMLGVVPATLSAVFWPNWNDSDCCGEKFATCWPL